MAKLINLTEGMRFGAGVDGLTEEVRGLPIRYDAIETTGGNAGQRVRTRVRMIESQESLMEAMNLSVTASVRYGLASGDAKFSIAQERSVNQYSLYMLLSASVSNPPRHMKNPRLTEEAARIYRSDPEAFRQVFGDWFIDEIYSGGEFFGLFVFDTVDERSRTDIKASLDVSVGNFLAGGEISATFESAVKSAQTKSSMRISALMDGGRGLENPTDLNDLKDLYSSFNVSVQQHPIDYKASIKELRYLPLPVGATWAEQAVRRDVIEQAGRRVLDGIRMRGDIEFILRFPEQFEDPDLPALRAAYSAIDAQLPKIAARARECARNIDQCSLEGLMPVTIGLPKRIATAGNPLLVKWEEIRRHDSRAAPYFPQAGMRGPIETVFDRHGEGQYKLFYKDQSGGAPIGGIFWHPAYGAHVVYGAIMQEYLRRGHCEGPLGFPKTDEAALSGPGADGLDRISIFERGQLWWDAQTGKVSDKRPVTKDLLILKGTALRVSDLKVAAHRLRP